MLDFNRLKDKLEKEIGRGALKIILSNPMKRNEEKPHKISAEKIKLKDKQVFQFSYFIGKKVVHENFEKDGFEALIYALEKMSSEGFKQCFISAVGAEATVLMNRKMQFSLSDIKKKDNAGIGVKAHNREKNYILKDNEPVQWMIALGLMSRDGVVLSHKQKKFRQINKFLEMVEDIEGYIPENGIIVDMGCGKSYLTFAMYYYFNELKKKNVKIMGFDLKADVVERCNRLAEEFGFDRLKFYADDIAKLNGTDEKINMIITLHACDTATDYALFNAVKWGCRVIMSVPCCQHELFGQIKNDSLKMLLRHGILKERFSALLTDGLRADMLELCGYKTTVTEFIETEHTPKNIMIRGIKKSNFIPDKKKAEELRRLIESFNADPAIYRLLKDRI